MVDEVIDARGRVLQLRKLSVLDRLRLFEAAGAELSRNDRWLGLAVLAASVGAIDGVPVPVPVPLPASKAGIEASVQRLDEAGLAAVAAGLQPEPAFDKALAGN
jgi:hypothetical protein